MRSKLVHCLVILSLGLVTAQVALAYPVGPALPLEELFEQSDLVCKATAISSKEVDDASFEKSTGFRPHETRLKVIAVYRGKEEAKEILFRHYAPSDKDSAFSYEPQHYTFDASRTYILFAKKAAGAGQYRQLWDNHKSQEDQGLLLAASEAPQTGLTIEEIFWLELTGLLESKQPADVKYALAHLDLLSGGDWREQNDFDRGRVLGAIAPLMRNSQPEIAQAAIAAIGGHNPYSGDDFITGWLATVGKGHIPGYASWDLTKTYPGGKLYWKELAAVVELVPEFDGRNTVPLESRVLALRALGRGQADEVRLLAEKWVRDPEPRIRGTAALLLADYPKQANTKLLKQLTKDSEPAARKGAAQAIGCGQFGHLIPDLAPLVDDADPLVAKAAALSLLSFSLEDSREALTAHLNHKNYHPLFLNALAQDDAEPYLDQLCQVIRTNRTPENWWGGFVVWGDSWNVLYRYAYSQPAEKLASAKLKPVLDALEFPATKNPQGPSYYSSSEPRDLYALYVNRGMTERAKAFRELCKKTIKYDIDYYFKEVDERPNDYGKR
jgi:hypothetical protein